MRSSDRRGEVADDAVLRLVQEHAAELLRFANRFSHCPDDAHDAYQRSLEILMRRMRDEPPARPLSWVRTVLRHEALAIRQQRDRSVGRFDLDLERHTCRHREDPAERALDRERLGQAAEALQRLKPQELTALVLLAEGLSYREICDRTGWSYTRCNRSIYEGRRALADRFDAIESGAECERLLPLLSALADGEATAVELAALRPHLRACAGCRATLRGFHAAPAHVAALVPATLVPLAAERGGSLLGHLELALHALAERASVMALRIQGAVEGAAGRKLAAVAASTAALAGGGVAIEQATRFDDARPRDRATAADAGAARSLALATSGLALAGPLSVTTATAAHRGPRRPSPPSEFAPAPRRPSEFSPRGAAAPEFPTGTASASASAETGAAARSASSGPAAPAASPGHAAPARAAPAEFAPPEFDGP